jgi:dephospho-CoA kinase
MQMKVIGITGGVGAGKSEILKYLKEKHGAIVIEADKVGHLLMEPGGACYYTIVEKFGSSVLNGDQTINRSKLSKIVFASEALLGELNKIIHPRVKSYIVSEIAKERAYHRTKYFVVEAALLLEDHYDVICDELWYIHTDEKVRAARLKESRGYDDEKIASICANQKSPEEFRSGCHIVIDNSGDLADTQKQIDEQLGR